MVLVSDVLKGQYCGVGRLEDAAGKGLNRARFFKPIIENLNFNLMTVGSH